MKKFLFSLETLLQYRRNLEEMERTKFSRIRGELLAALAHRESLCARQARTFSELTLEKMGGCDSQEIDWFYRFLDRLAYEIKRSAKQIAELEKQLEKQKEIMIETSRAKKIIENLEQKKKKEFLSSLERQEQKSVDEMVVTRFALKQ